jgi:predicted phage tail protein
MAKPETSTRENAVIALGAVLLIVMFYGGGAIGSNYSETTGVGTLIGLLAGTGAWALVFGTVCWLLAPKPKPLETSPFDDDQPEETEPDEDEDDHEEQEPVDLDYFEMEQARQAEEYPTREGW